jgi:hypothetical protein
MFGRSRVQISAWRQAIFTEEFRGFAQNVAYRKLHCLLEIQILRRLKDNTIGYKDEK